MLEVGAWERPCGSASLVSLPHLSKPRSNLLLVICAIGNITWGRREAERNRSALSGAELASGHTRNPRPGPLAPVARTSGWVRGCATPRKKSNSGQFATHTEAQWACRAGIGKTGPLGACRSVCIRVRLRESEYGLAFLVPLPHDPEPATGEQVK
jgi:hypothetical protein